jgi:hypothetical protein
MASPKNKENIGNYWKEKISYDEVDILNWIKGLDINNLTVLFNGKKYNNLKNFLSIVNRKLDVYSRKLFNFYFRKNILNNNKCTYCKDEISKDFILKFNCDLNHLPNWCEKHYNEKKWLENNGKHSDKANEKRSKKRIEWLQTPDGEKYKQDVGEKNKINTKKWKNKLTEEQKIKINKKSSQSQINNILKGKFNPQKNYTHYNKNKCFINNKEYTFRSSWEVIFFISNSTLEYETIRIKYQKNNNKEGIYIPDFIDRQNNIIYELKPRRNYVKQQNKMDAGISWSIKEGYSFIWINENNLLDYINEEDNKDERNCKFYKKALIGIHGNFKNKINKEKPN